jgi:hypothetical protein
MRLSGFQRVEPDDRKADQDGPKAEQSGHALQARLSPALPAIQALSESSQGGGKGRRSAARHARPLSRVGKGLKPMVH